MGEEEKQSGKKSEPNTAESTKRTEEDDERNWKWLSPKRGESLTKIRHAVEKLWSSCEKLYPPLPYYTPHGPAHSKSVENLIHRLLPGDVYRSLKEIERYYLLAAAWTHDVGMIRGLMNERDGNIHPNEIRRVHHKRSEYFIVNRHSMLDIEEGDAQALGLLAFFHRRAENLKKCPELFVVGTETVRLRLLAAYIRLADSLDIGQSRAPSSDYAICLAYNIPFASKLHWIKSRFVSGIAIIPEQHLILVHFKQPHEQDLRERFPGEHIQPLRQNLTRLQKTVMKELREELDSVKTTLIRGEITYYLDVVDTSTEMVIDDQVFPEIIRLADDLDMITHPSATKLIFLLLETIAHIIERHLSSLNKSAGCCADCSNKNSGTGIGVCPVDPQDSDVCQMPKLIKREIKDFLVEIKEQVISQRKCHIGLERLIEHLDRKVEHGSIKEITEFIRRQQNRIKNERRRVRAYSYQYFCNGDIYTVKKNTINDRIKHLINDAMIPKKQEMMAQGSETTETAGAAKEDKSFQWDDKTNYINILVYGYSELVIKSLTGFRDVVIGMVIRQLADIHDDFKCKDLNNPFDPLESIPVNSIKMHKISIEGVASRIFRIFVCEGQPKTITAPNDTLQYHDGTRFAVALSRRGFNNVIVIPDLVAGSLLKRTQKHLPKVGSVPIGIGEAEVSVDETAPVLEPPKIDYILLGVNGVRLSKDNPQEDVFLHSSGHMAIASLAHHLSKIEGEDPTFTPRLVLVLSISKCKFYQKSRNDSASNSALTTGNGSKKEFETRQGYRFWKGYGVERTRKEPFLARDAEVRNELFECNIALYNPREDAVELSMVDDIISDMCSITDVTRKRDMLLEIVSKYLERQNEGTDTAPTSDVDSLDDCGSPGSCSL
jgi:hypothetical protein